jgi:PAS domain-containing protein
MFELLAIQEKKSGSVEFVVVVTDVTEGKRAEEALRRSESYLAEAQRLTHTGGYAWSVASKEIVYWSREIYRLYGFDPEQGIPPFETFRQRIHPEIEPTRPTCANGLFVKGWATRYSSEPSFRMAPSSTSTP